MIYCPYSLFPHVGEMLRIKAVMNWLTEQARLDDNHEQRIRPA